MSYDRNGNLTNYAASTYGWDYKNRLTALYASSSPTTLFGYDHTANRVFKGYNGATTTLPSKYYNIEIANYATSTATTTKSIFTPNGELIATVTTVGATSTRKYIHTDHLGGMNAGTDSNGDTVEIEDTYPYGAPRISETYGAPKNQRQFAGTERGFQQNMDYMVNRYYSYDRGQFISQDPVSWELGITSDGKKALVDPQLQNSYSYARGNPVINKDPDGRLTLDGSFNYSKGLVGGGVGITIELYPNPGYQFYTTVGAGPQSGGSLKGGIDVFGTLRTPGQYSQGEIIGAYGLWGASYTTTAPFDPSNPFNNLGKDADKSLSWAIGRQAALTQGFLYAGSPTYLFNSGPGNSSLGAVNTNSGGGGPIQRSKDPIGKDPGTGQNIYCWGLCSGPTITPSAPQNGSSPKPAPATKNR